MPANKNFHRKKSLYRLGERYGYIFDAIAFGKDVQKHRESLGLTRKEVGELLGTSHVMVGVLENGNANNSSFMIFLAHWAGLNVMNYLRSSTEPLLPLTYPTGKRE